MRTLPRPTRAAAAITLVAVVGCLLAATGLFASCHEDEAPMACCPDSGSVAATAAPAWISTPPVLATPFAALVLPETAALVPPRAEPPFSPWRDVYLRLSTLLI